MVSSGGSRLEVQARRAEELVALSLDLASSLGLPELVRSFTLRAMQMMGATGATLSLAHGSNLETVVLIDDRVAHGREHLNELGRFFTRWAAVMVGAVQQGCASELLDGSLQRLLGWEDVTIARITAAGGDLVGLLALADRDAELHEDDVQMLQALVAHAAIALENSRLFARITQSSKQWAEIFDSITDFIVVHDEEHRVMRVNRPLSESIGARPAELIGIHMRNLLSKGQDDGDQPCPFCLPRIEEGDFIHSVLGRTYLVSTSRVHGPVHEGMQTIHVLKDVTERREAERRYQDLFSTIQEGAFFSTADGRFIEVNDALVRMLGYTAKDELMRVDITTQFYASPAERERVRRLTDAGLMDNQEVRLRHRNGSVIYALENAVAVRDSIGNVVQYRGLILDVTETKKFQAQLERERDFNRQILSNTQSMILVADTAGLVSYANRRCFASGEFHKDSLQGRKLLAVISPEHHSRFVSAFDKVLGGEVVSNLDLTMRRSSGEGRFSVNMSPMRDDQGLVNSVVIVMSDITELAMMQNKLLHTEKLAALGQLVSGVAHEVNNPLTAIMGFTDLMIANPELPGSVHQDLQVVLQEAQRTKEIVQNLLSFARQTPPQRQPVNLNNVLRRTVALRSYDFSSRGVEVKELLEESLPQVVGDGQQLQQVFLNILNNAYDAIQEARSQGKIEIITRSDHGFAQIEIRDNGVGIRNPERIFDPFFTTKEVGKGTGLGLSICYGIIHEHGGDITCSNNVNDAGATFCVRLPFAANSSASVAKAGAARK